MEVLSRTGLHFDVCSELAVRRNSLTEQGRGRAESVDEARSPAERHCYITNVTPVKELSRLMKLGLLPCDATASQIKAVEELSQLMSLGLLPLTLLHHKCDASEGAESVGEARSPAERHCYITNVTPVKELSRLMKLGLLPCDATASQIKAVEELSQLMSLGLLPLTLATSQM